jgi:predicted  nucleic acid-binding Zn-ribbon protein
MQGTSIKNLLKKLIELQKIDGEIFNCKKDLKEKPETLNVLDQEFQSKKAGLKELEDKLRALILQRKDIELQLKEKEDAIIKSNAQLSLLKTNKEYQTKLNEIESIKADKSILEEKILISYDQADTITAEINKEKAAVAEEEKKFAVQKKVIEDQIKVLEDRINVLDSQRKQYLPDIDPNYLAMYERVLNHKSGIAIVPYMEGNICGGCYMLLTPQMANAIKMYDQLITCEMCSRILYLEEDL